MALEKRSFAVGMLEGGLYNIGYSPLVIEAPKPQLR